MKSRIVFLCTLAAFLNPIASMALETKVASSDIACQEWAKGKMLSPQAAGAVVTAAGSGKKSSSAE